MQNLLSLDQALWLSGYSDRLEIYFLREQEFESLRRRMFCLITTNSLLVAVGAGRRTEKTVREPEFWAGVKPSNGYSVRFNIGQTFASSSAIRAYVRGETA
jgi:hypothetical protein